MTGESEFAVGSPELMDRIIKEYLPEEKGFQKIIFEAMNYSVCAGGKRIRPLLMYETYRAFCGREEVIRPFLAAMEMIHTYSLVHDDLPCMDNDLYRRGLPTTWSKFGEDMGVLAGDSLLGYAFETALKGYSSINDKDAFFKALKILAEKSGCYGMLGGQVVDVGLTGKPMTKEQMFFVYELKTSALIECSMMIGGALAGADDKRITALESIASKVGLAFQIKDDILDVTGDEAVIGKPVGSDQKNNKTTYVTVYGLEAAEKKVTELMDEASEGLFELGCDTSVLKSIFDSLVYRNH